MSAASKPPAANPTNSLTCSLAFLLPAGYPLLPAFPSSPVHRRFTGKPLKTIRKNRTPGLPIILTISSYLYSLADGPAIGGAVMAIRLGRPVSLAPPILFEGGVYARTRSKLRWKREKRALKRRNTLTTFNTCACVAFPLEIGYERLRHVGTRFEPSRNPFVIKYGVWRERFDWSPKPFVIKYGGMRRYEGRYGGLVTPLLSNMEVGINILGTPHGINNLYNLFACY